MQSDLNSIALRIAFRSLIQWLCVSHIKVPVDLQSLQMGRSTGTEWDILIHILNYFIGHS